MIRAVIIDDEKDAIGVLTNLLKKFCPEVVVVGFAQNITDGFKVITHENPDLVFLDVYMPNGTGLELMERIPDRKVIFTTAFNEFAIRAIKLSAFDYLLKPINHVELRETVMRFQEEQNKELPDISVLQNLLKDGDDMQRISIATVDRIHIVNIADISHCEASKSYTIVHLIDKSYHVASKPIGEFEKLLTSFIRIHRSFLVNPAHIVEMRKGKNGSVKLSTAIELEVSQSNREVLMRKFGIN
ncbi:MAG: response regulator transcription factor [Cyclobacteriaceae bacterium]